jgi:predicted dehydrogenase
MQPLATVNWGIIGVGDVTEVKSGPAFYSIEHSRLVAVMRRDAAKAADYARRHGVGRWYADGAELIGDPDVNAVYVATPPHAHARYAIEAMQAGKPVYVEKPMALNHAECREMLRVSEQTGMPLRVAYYRRTLPAFLKARELVGAGAIGRALTVEVRLYKAAAERTQSREEMHWHVSPAIGGAGHFFDLASHQFDYLDFVFGKITRAEGWASNRAGLYPAEDTVTGTWLHESGVAGTGSWSFVVDPVSERDEMRMLGEKGEITLSCFTDPGMLRLATAGGTREFRFENPENISRNLVQQVVDELRGVGTCVSTGESAARTSRVLDRMVQNYYSE